jgi:hypothetical protein|tara:strand:+ start:1854 stop:5303 length:3450 start_codon:yes stop_codon:yes gene_type:complete
MAYTTLAESFFDDDHGNRYKLTIDNLQERNADYNPSNYSFTVGQDLDMPRGGCMVSFENDLSNGIYSPITTSKLELDYFVTTDDEHEFIKYLSEQPDYKIQAHLRPNTAGSTGVFRGFLVPDQIKIELGGYPYQVKLVFVDGLALLKDVAYKERDDNSVYDDYQTLKITVGRAITRIRDAYNYYRGSTPQQGDAVPIDIVEYIDLFNKNFGTSTTFDDVSVLYTLKINQQTFNKPSTLANPVGTGFRVFEDTMSCYEVLEHICIALGCRLHFRDDTLYFISPTTYHDGSTCRGFRHSNTSLLSSSDGDDRLEDPSLAGDGITALSARADFTDLDEYDLLEGSTRYQLPALRGVVYTHKDSGSQRVLGGRYPIPRTAPPQYAETFSNISYNLEQYGYESGIENVFTTHVLYSRLRSALGTPDTYFDFENLSVVNNPFTALTAKHDYYEAPARVEHATVDRVTLQGINSTEARELVSWSEDYPLEDTEIDVPDDIPFRFQTTAYVNTNFDNDVTIGAKIVLRFVIKVGGYYLKQHVTAASYDDDEIPHEDGFEIIKPGGNARYMPLRATADAEWTQTATDRFEIVLNNPDLLELPSEFATLQHIDADGNSYEYGGGIATILEPRTDDSEVDRLRHRNNMMGSQAENFHNFRMPIDIDIPALPDAAANQTGIKVYLKDVIAYDAGGSSFNEQEMDDFLRANVRFENVKFFLGTGDKGDDATYFVASDSPDTDIVERMPPSVVGGRPAGWFGTAGYLYAGSQDYSQQYASFISGVPYVAASKDLYEVHAEEYMRFRNSARYVYDLKLQAPGYVSGQTFRDLLHYEDRPVFTIDSTELQMCPISIRHDITQSITEMTCVQMGRDTDSITEAQDTGRDPTGTSGDDVGGLPTEAIDTTREAQRRGKRPGLPVVDSKKLSHVNLTADKTGIASFTVSATENLPLSNFENVFASGQSRTGITNDRILTVTPTQEVDELGAGTKGQVLKSGGTTQDPDWGYAPYIIASSSTRIPMYYANRYYMGSSLYGWDTDTGYSTSQTGRTSLLDDYAHMGIVCPTDISTLKIFGTLRNDTNAADVTVWVLTGAAPNGSSSSISLTDVKEVAVSVTTTDRHYSFSGTANNLSISEGDLIFVFFQRTELPNGSTFVNTSYTILVEQ